MLEKIANLLDEERIQYFFKLPEANDKLSLKARINTIELKSTFMIYPFIPIIDMSVMLGFENQIQKEVLKRFKRAHFSPSNITTGFWHFGYGFIVEQHLSVVGGKDDNTSEFANDIIFYPNIAIATTAFLYDINKNCISTSNFDIYRNPFKYKDITRK